VIHSQLGLKHRSVLIIEDDVFMARLLGFVLHRQGAAIEYAKDGIEAMEQIEQPCGFDAVLLDLLLPFHGGMEVLARMRQTPGWCDVPVLIVSDLDKGEEIARAFRAGADDFVTKPFNPDELVARLSRRLRPQQSLL
jgi:DNA-binding response OmpR family regulator